MTPITKHLQSGLMTFILLRVTNQGAGFHLVCLGFVNGQQCRIWANFDLFGTQPVISLIINTCAGAVTATAQIAIEISSV